MLMLSEGQRDLVRDKGTILGRALIGLLFLAGGLSMLFMQTPAGVAGYFTAAGIPLAGIVAWIVIAIKIIAGGAIIIGKRVGLASAVLVLFTVGATIIGHMGLSDVAPFEMTAVLKNLAVIGGLMYLMAYGPGGSHTTKLA